MNIICFGRNEWTHTVTETFKAHLVLVFQGHLVSVLKEYYRQPSRLSHNNDYTCILFLILTAGKAKVFAQP
jgi:hypothetical protein